MIDYSKIKEHELKMLANQEGYMKFAKVFFDSQYGISSPFTEEEFHQAIEYQKELVKRNIEESDCSKEQKTRNIDASFPVNEEYLKTYYFVRIIYNYDRTRITAIPAPRVPTGECSM